MKKSFSKMLIFIILTISVLWTSCFAVEEKSPVNLRDLPEILASGNHQSEILVKSGTYYNIDFTLKNLKPVIIRAEKAGEVVLKGKTQIRFQRCDSLTLSGFYFDRTWSKQLIKFNNTTNCIIENMLFKGSQGSSPYSHIIGIQENSAKNIIRNNTFERIETMGIAIDDGNNQYNTIAENVFKNIASVKTLYPQTNGNGMECIGVGRWNKKPNSDLYTTISNNYFENIRADGMEIICVKSNKNIISNNFFTQSLGGISLRYGNDSLIESNVFVANGQNIRIFGSGHMIKDNYIENNDVGIQLPAANYKRGQKEIRVGYFQAKNIVIQGNKFENMRTAALSVGIHYAKERSMLPEDVVFENNLGVDELLIQKAVGKKITNFSNISSVNPRNNQTLKYRLNTNKDNFYYGIRW